MALYLLTVTSFSVPDSIVERIYQFEHTQLSENTWLIAGDDTSTKELGESIVEPEDVKPSYMVVKIESYWGRQPNDVWEWMTEAND